MKLKNVTLAAALLAVLTGCGSSGGGSNNSAPNAEINNNQATQAQIEQQKAEVEKLKQQLYQAQNTQKQAEDKLKVTENSSKADVATAQKNLADAQAKLANIQQNLAQAEKNLAENKTNQASLQKQLSQAQQAVEQAKLAKENSEKVLNQQLKSKENDVAQAKKSLEDAKAQLSTAQENLNKLQNRLDNLPTNQKEFDKQFTQAQKALEDAKQAKLDAETNLNKQIADRNADLAKVQENLTASNNKLAQVEKELKAAQASIQQSNADKTSIETQLNTAKQNLQAAKQEQAKAQESFNQQLAGKEANLAKAQQDLTASNNKLAQAEKELKAVQASAQQSNSDKSLIETQLNQAKKDLEAAQKSKEEAEKTLKDQLVEKEQLLNTAQKEKNDAYDKLQAALDAKQKAEKALADKNALEQPLDKARTLEFSLNGGLNNQDAQDFSERYKDKSKSELQDILNGWHKHIRLLDLARDQAGYFGFYDNESRETFAKEFAKENKDKTVDEAYEVLNEKLKQHNAELEKERLEHEKQVNALVDIAKAQGLSDSNAQNFANTFANNNQNLSQDEFKSQLQAKMTELVNQAKAVGLDENVANQFAKENVNNSGDSLEYNLNQLKVNLERLEHEKQVNALVDIAKAQGLSDSNAQNFANTFANNNQNLSQDEFKSQLQAKMTELVNQAKAVGLDENVANQFAKENVNNSGDSLEYNLNQLKVNLFTELANNSGLSQSNVYNLIHMNGNTLLSTDDFKKLIKASLLIIKGTENDYLGDYEVAFIKKYLSLSDAEIEAKIQKRNELRYLLDGYYSDIIDKDSNFSSERENFLNNNAEKSQEEQFAEIAKIFKKNYINLDNHPENQISNIPLKTSKSSNVHYENSRKVYNQTYSVTLGEYLKETRDGYNPTSYERFTIENKGLQTKENGLPTEGHATYTGKAFSLENNGDLTYNVNFSERKGSGTITGFQKYGTITLEEAPLKVKPLSKQVGIQNGNVTLEKDASIENYSRPGYQLDFYGPKAEEIGGRVSFGSMSYIDGIGFGGTRGEIQK